MTAVAFNKFYAFPLALGSVKHNLGSDTFYMQLLASAPDQVNNAVETDLPADLGSGNGYTVGGITMGAAASFTQTSGVAKLVLNDTLLTASGGTIGPFRYGVLLNNTATNKDLIGYFDYGYSITLNDGEFFNFDFDQTNGLFTIT